MFVTESDTCKTTITATSKIYTLLPEISDSSTIMLLLSVPSEQTVQARKNANNDTLRNDDT